MNDLISVVVPVFNSELTIRQCIDSILRQTYKNIEILLINDGSEDVSLQICEDYSYRYKNIRVFSQTNKGVSAARNLGLKNHKGKYITFVDSDDIIGENLITTLYKELINGECDIAISNVGHANSENSSKTIVEYLNSTEAIKNTLIANGYAGHVCGKLFSSNQIRELSFVEGISYHEDTLFTIEAMMLAKRVVYINRVMYHYILRDTSATMKSFSSKSKMSFEIYVAKLNYLRDKISGNIDIYFDANIIGSSYSKLLSVDNKDKQRRQHRAFLRRVIMDHFSWSAFKMLPSTYRLKLVLVLISPRIFTFTRKIKRYTKDKIG